MCQTCIIVISGGVKSSMYKIYEFFVDKVLFYVNKRDKMFGAKYINFLGLSMGRIKRNVSFCVFYYLDAI